MIKITLGDEKLPHVEYEKNGIARSFDIDHNTLFDFIQRNCYETKETKKKLDMLVFETPVLPPNTVKYMALPDGKVVLFMQHKESKEDITYHSTKFKQVPFPNLLFMFVFVPRNDEYTLQNKKCFAFKDKVFRETTKLYRFPFSHVQADGEMCYFDGPDRKDLAQMTSFIHNWMRVPFTDHYYNQRDRNKWGLPLRQVFEQSQKKNFDYSKLVEEDVVVQDLVNRTVNMYFPKN